MAIFFKKNNKEEEKCCCCGGNCDPQSMENAERLKNEGPTIKILGSGCSKCKQLEANTKEALSKMNLDIDIEHVTDFAQIASYGVLTTPALVVNGKVVSYGKVLKPEEVIKTLEEVL